MIFTLQPDLAGNSWQDILEWDPASLGPSETRSERRKEEEEDGDNFRSERSVKSNNMLIFIFSLSLLASSRVNDGGEGGSHLRRAL